MNEFTIVAYIGSVIIALCVGLLTGIFGVGGGFLITPALMILLGVDGNIAVGTGLVMIFVNSSFCMYKRRHSKTVDYKLGTIIASAAVVGITIGLFVMDKLKDMPPLTILGKSQDAVQYILLCIFLGLLGLITFLMAIDLRRNGDSEYVEKPFFNRFDFPPYVNLITLTADRTSLIPIVIFGIIVGFLISLLGVGGGVVILPALIYLIGQHPIAAAGTSLLVVWISSIIAGSGHVIQGNIEFILLGCMLVGGLVGTNIGTHVGLNLHGAKIKKYFVVIVAFAVAMVAVKLCLITFNG